MDYTLAKLHKPKTGDDWYIYYTFRSPETGKMVLWKERGKINRYKSVKEKKHEGAIMVARQNELLDKGWSPYTQAITSKKSLVEALNEIYQIKIPGLRPRTIQHYKHAIDLITEYLPNKGIFPNQFTPVMAQGYCDFLITKKGYTLKSHNNQLSNANIFFNALVDREIIDKNPFKKVKRKSVEEGKLNYYNKETKVKIAKFTQKNGHPMFIFIQFVYFCFVRPYELMQIQVKHIDFENGTLIIPAHASKNKKSGIVPIKESFLKLLEKEYKGLEPEYYLFGKGLRPSETQVHRNRASKSHQDLLKELGIKELKLYDWKNTGARDYILEGNNPYSLMSMMRHHSLDQTMVYMRSLGLAVGMKTDPKAWNFYLEV